MKVFIVSVVVLGAFIDLTYQSQSAAEWTYGDQEHWPGYCNTGSRQSPINIVTKEVLVDFHQERIKGPLSMRGYSAVDMVGMNNGHTLEWILVPTPRPNLLPMVSGGPLVGNYTFMQFHLHWLSEHAIDNMKYPLEIHMVHVKTGLTFEEAINLPDGITVIGVFFEVKERGSDHALKEVMEMVPDLVNKTEELPDTAVIMDVTRLISSEPESYYTYEGSLTTPDCQEAVTWIVMEKPLEMTPAQYQQLSRVNIGGVPNYRRLQPANRRPVYRPASCGSLATFSLSLGILSALWHCGWQLASAAYHGLCLVNNLKRNLFGKKVLHCGSR